MDCKQRNSTVSKKAQAVSTKVSPYLSCPGWSTVLGNWHHLLSKCCLRADFGEGEEDSNFSFFRVRRFSEWPEALHWIAFPVEKSLPNPWFTELPPPFSLKSPFFHWKLLRRIPFNQKIGSNCLRAWTLLVVCHGFSCGDFLVSFCLSFKETEGSKTWIEKPRQHLWQQPRFFSREDPPGLIQHVLTVGSRIEMRAASANGRFC